MKHWIFMAAASAVATFGCEKKDEPAPEASATTEQTVQAAEPAKVDKPPAGSDPLVGAWVPRTIVDDAGSHEADSSVFGKFVMALGEAGKFEALFDGKEEEGTWKREGSRVTLSGAKEATLELGADGTLTRSGESEDGKVTVTYERVDAAKLFQPVATKPLTKEALVGKWKVKEVRHLPPSQDALSIFKHVAQHEKIESTSSAQDLKAEGSLLEIHPDGKLGGNDWFQSAMEGTWKLEGDKATFEGVSKGTVSLSSSGELIREYVDDELGLTRVTYTRN